jgi:hypothetical protein
VFGEVCAYVMHIQRTKTFVLFCPILLKLSECIISIKEVHDIYSLKGGKSCKAEHQKLCVWQAVEVLWTPQDENDTLSERELLRDYPLLRPLWILECQF